MSKKGSPSCVSPVSLAAEKLRSKLHLKQDSIDEGSQVAQFVSSMNLQGVGSVQMGSMLSLRPTLSMMSSASVPDGDSFFQSYIPSRQRADTRSSLPVVPVSRAASTMSSLPSMDLQTVHAQSLLESSPVRQHRGSTEAPVRVSVEPRVHRYGPCSSRCVGSGPLVYFTRALQATNMSV